MLGFDGLAQEFVATLAHGLALEVHVALGGEEDDGDGKIGVLLADHLGQFLAGGSGHVHVQQDQLRNLFVQGLQGLQGVGHHLADEAGAPQMSGVERGDGGRIVDDQDLARLGLIRRGDAIQGIQQAGHVQRTGEIGLTTHAHRVEPHGDVFAVG